MKNRNQVSPMIRKQLRKLEKMTTYFTDGSLTKDQYEIMMHAVDNLFYVLKRTQRRDIKQINTALPEIIRVNAFDKVEE